MEDVDLLRQRLAAYDVDVSVSTAPPLVRGPYPTECYTCPHGTQYWVEPTGEQIAQWHRDNAP